MDQGSESMLDMYLFETNTLIEQLDEILLNAERNENFSTEDVNEIFRIMHTVKGSSAMMQFSPIMTVSHHIEDLFYSIRSHEMVLDDSSALFQLMFQCCDFLKLQVEKIQNNEPLNDSIDNLVDEINSFLKTISKEASANSGASGAKTRGNHGNFALRVFFDDGCGMENLRSFMLVSSLTEVCAEFRFTPSDVETNPATSSIIIDEGLLLDFQSKKDMDSAITVIKGFPNVFSYEIISMQGEIKVNHDRRAAEESKMNQELSNDKPEKNQASTNNDAPPPAVSDGSSQFQAKQSLISVNLTKLDKLMNIVGEIVITESMVTSSPELQGVKLDTFTKSARQLRKLTDELQDIVMSARMLPVAGVFQRMHRIVRDIGKSLNKNVKLTIIGEDTEVDKTIVDNIGDPIMHMVRNSMDHGIEDDVEERVRLGKPKQAEIVLEAAHTGSEVIIKIKDDGRGVDTAKVLAKAKDNGLLTKPESDYTEKEILSLLLLPGFSTKSEDEVTEYSGRGVGMDVVKKNIEKIGGNVTMTTEMGKGTCTTFKIPLTLAIVDGMEIAVGKSTFMIPIMNIRQSFKVTKDDIVFDAQQREMIRRMNNFYPMLRLHELYSIEEADADIENGIVIWVESGEKSYCLFVDELLGEQQVVVKPLPKYLNSFNVKSSGIAGCTILGDGNISIILDILSLYDASWA